MKRDVSVVIRARNEETYIRACLDAVLNQSLAPKEVVVVDNMSTDKTAEIARGMGVAVVSISEYSPGKALNIGISHTTGDYIALLSAHCVPKSHNWLEELTRPLEDDHECNVAGVYGRQVPLPYSHPQDKRDLYAVFGEEDRLQKRDSFFHNANSVIRRTVWAQIRFDESTPHIEDRIWAKAIHNQGFAIFYCAEAEVYHWNGLHASSDLVRADRSISILNSLGVGDDEVPDFLRPSKFSTQPIIPAWMAGKDVINFRNQLEDLCLQIDSCEFLSKPILVTERGAELSVSAPHTIVAIERELNVEDATRRALVELENTGAIPDFVLYANPEYLDHSPKIFENLLSAILSTGAETAFCGYQDYGHIWATAADGHWRQIDSSMKPREQRSPIYRALYGLGTVSRAAVVREGNLIGAGVTILPVDSYGFKGLKRGGLESHASR